MEKLLNVLLADLVVEYHKLQNFHWYVKGKDFFQVHTKLEELYNAVNGAVDEVAESILMIGGKPLGNLKEIMEVSSIVEANSEEIKSKYIFREVQNDFLIILNEVKDIKKVADEEGIYLISAAMDEYIKQNGYLNDINNDRLHHEIYMSDARKVVPEKWKTVIRHPIRKA